MNKIPGISDRSSLPKTTVCELSSIELNPTLNESVFFSTAPERLPIGTVFQDLITGVAYTIGEGPISDERIRSIIDDAVEAISMESSPESALDHEAETNQRRPLLGFRGINSSPADMVQESTATRRYVAVSATLLIAASCASLLFIFRRKHSRTK